MRILASFDDDKRNRKVNYKSNRVVVHTILKLPAEGTDFVILNASNSLIQRRTMYLNSSLVLDEETYTTKATVLDNSEVVLNTIYMIPNQAVVVPLEEDATTISITSNSASDGDIEVLVTENV